ncbi:MAG: tRNA threonylcarbamoyladenosine biosynthesis protein TsaE [Candidatus Paceibacteria bacterium]|jgi:tRNA threonylcarbamoyladenosine biosynthesis protein TsaE
MLMKGEYKITTPEDFQSIIDDVLVWHKKSKQKTLVIALQGDLGAGKTTFTQELGRHLKVTEHITSPTFTIMKQYEINYDDFDFLVHIDAYRIEDEAEAIPLRLSEIFEKPRTLVCIEWPEQIPSLVPKTAVLLKLEMGDSDVRIVTTQLSFEK